MSKILDELNILRIKGRIWIPNKSFPLQIQIVGKRINTWFEEAPNNCWRPNDNAGLEIVIISFDEKSIKILNKKIKEKFKILSEPKIAIWLYSYQSRYLLQWRVLNGKSKNGKIDLNYLFDFNFKKETYREFLTEEHDHNHVELVSDSFKLNYFLEKNDFEK